MMQKPVQTENDSKNANECQNMCWIWESKLPDACDWWFRVRYHWI